MGKEETGPELQGHGIIMSQQSTFQENMGLVEGGRMGGSILTTDQPHQTKKDRQEAQVF